MSSSRVEIHHRIRAACTELELAIQDFDDADEAAKLRLREEALKLQELKDRLSEIRRQLDDLSK